MRHVKSSRYSTMLILTSLLLFSTSLVPATHQIPILNSNQGDSPRQGYNNQLAYTPHDPISITSNAGFSGYGFPGNGSPLNPYMISNYLFNVSDECISISNTDAHFIIQDCLLVGDSAYTGIYFENVINGIVRNNSIDRGGNAISLLISSGIEIVNNSMSENYGSLYVFSSSNNKFVNNTISRALFDRSSDNTLVNNTFLGSPLGGISLWESPDNTLLSNNILEDGIRVWGSSVEDWRQNITTDNIVNGKPILYLWNRTGEIIDGSQYGIVILANCVELILENCVITDKVSGIVMGFSSNCTLRKNTMSRSFLYGIALAFSSENIVVDNTVSETNDNGVFLYHSDGNVIVSNRISQNSYGIYFHDLSNYNSLINNTFSYNTEYHVREYGVFNKLVNNTMMGGNKAMSIRGQHATVMDNTILGPSQVGINMDEAAHCQIMNNIISRHASGIMLSDDSYNNTMEKNIISENGDGVYFYWGAYFNTLENNTISGNDIGVYIDYDCNNNKVVNNTITWNERYGVFCGIETYENQLYLNVFVNNGQNGHDKGSGNHWNTTGVGNYWSDYSGTGVYNIPGTAGSIDYHPFVCINQPPINTTPTIPTVIDGGLFSPGVVLVASVGAAVIILAIYLRYTKRE